MCPNMRCKHDHRDIIILINSQQCHLVNSLLLHANYNSVVISLDSIQDIHFNVYVILKELVFFFVYVLICL